MARLGSVLDAAGISREELRAIVLERQEEQRLAAQARVDAELLELGKQFRQERSEQREAPRAAVVPPSAPEPPVVVKETGPPPLIETARCAAYLCTETARATVVRSFSGRLLRVRYCRPHAREVRADKPVVAT